MPCVTGPRGVPAKPLVGPPRPRETAGVSASPTEPQSNNTSGRRAPALCQPITAGASARRTEPEESPPGWCPTCSAHIRTHRRRAGLRLYPWFVRTRPGDQEPWRERSRQGDLPGNFPQLPRCPSLPRTRGICHHRVTTRRAGQPTSLTANSLTGIPTSNPLRDPSPAIRARIPGSQMNSRETGRAPSRESPAAARRCETR